MELHIPQHTVHYFLIIVILIITVPLTVVALRQQQQLKQIAAAIDSTAPAPPIYGCLSVGESNKNNCASATIKSDLQASVHNNDVNGKTVFYGDTVVAKTTVTNVGDKLLNLKSLGIVGGLKEGSYKVDFMPNSLIKDLAIGATATNGRTVHTFNAPDPGGTWYLSTKVTVANGQSVEDIKQATFQVNTTCTALRAKPLTPTDISSLKKICPAGSNSDLCRQFCEVVPDMCNGGVPK